MFGLTNLELIWYHLVTFSTWPLNGPWANIDWKYRHSSFQDNHGFTQKGWHRTVYPGSPEWVSAMFGEHLRGKPSHLTSKGGGHSQISARAQVGDDKPGWYPGETKRERTENGQRDEELGQSKQSPQGWSWALPPTLGAEYRIVLNLSYERRWEPAWNQDPPAQLHWV